MNSTFVQYERPYEKLISKYGGRFDFWISSLDQVSKFIRSRRIRSLPKEHLIMDDPIRLGAAAKRELAGIEFLKPRPFPGGLRFPHLHFKKDIYRLTEKQWQDFSGTVLNNLRGKLDKAQTVSFEQVMELSEVIEGLG